MCRCLTTLDLQVHNGLVVKVEIKPYVKFYLAWTFKFLDFSIHWLLLILTLVKLIVIDKD